MEKLAIALIFVGLTTLFTACNNDEQKLPIIDTQQKAETQQIISTQHTAKLLPIFMFHYVRNVSKTKDPEGYDLSVTPSDFEKILQYLASNGYKTIHMADLEKTTPAPKSVILTFDDGYEDFYTTARPLLQKYGFTASEAIIAGKMDGLQFMSPIQITTIDQEGFEILAHTIKHVDLDQDPQQQKEIFGSKTILEKLLNKTVDTLVYPAGRYNNDTLKFTAAAGYTFGLTTKPGQADLNGDLLQLHRIRIDNRNGYSGFVKKLLETSQ